MKSDYWNVTDEQVIEKTGQPLAHWEKVLGKRGAAGKKSNDVVVHLQKEHDVPRYWDRTLTTWFLKQQEQPALNGLVCERPTIVHSAFRARWA